MNVATQAILQEPPGSASAGGSEPLLQDGDDKKELECWIDHFT